MNPFDLKETGIAKPLPSRGQGKRLAPKTRHMDINDTQSIDGLAVHLQSPSIKRRYWNTRYAARYRELSQMSQWSESITAYLQDHQCDALNTVFEEEMLHLKQLKAMKQALHMDEELVTLSGMEQSLFHQARYMGSLIIGIWDVMRNRWNSENTHQQPADILPPPARRALQRWMHQFTSDYKEDKNRMTSALVQDIYRLQHYL